MTCNYLIRFDDICPKMNWEIWNKIEYLLLKYEISPILAVVPNNKDPKLNVAPEEVDFWRKVKQWQEYGWTIALHGYDHVYISDDPGLIGINNRSEFSNVDRHIQKKKLFSAREIFDNNDIVIDTWVAPAHSFDEITLELLREIGVTNIRDGYFKNPVIDKQGMVWVPQQLWRFRNMPDGIWTICNHHNAWTDKVLSNFETDIQEYKDKIITFQSSLEKARPISFLDNSFQFIFRCLIKIKRLL